MSIRTRARCESRSRALPAGEKHAAEKRAGEGDEEVHAADPGDGGGRIVC